MGAKTLRSRRLWGAGALALLVMLSASLWSFNEYAKGWQFGAMALSVDAIAQDLAKTHNGRPTVHDIEAALKTAHPTVFEIYERESCSTRYLSRTSLEVWCGRQNYAFRLEHVSNP